MSLVMIVEPLSHLISVGIKKGGVDIEKHELRFSDGIDNLTRFTDNLVQMFYGVLIHLVEKL